MEQLSVGTGGLRYSVSDLLQLRMTLPVVACIISRINNHPDIAGIFRLPEEAFTNPESFSCQTKTLASLSNKLAVRQSTRRQLGNSSEESEQQNRSESSANQDLHQFQWNLRRRDDSDRSSQPYSAPSGLVAQQSENFRRFYRAVASPTHVRVTAGGRIVPNTRVAAIPAFEWNAETQHFEPVQPLHSDLNNTQQACWPQNNSNPSSTPFAANEFIPPYQFMPQGNTLLLPVMAHQISGSISPSEKKSIEDEHGSIRVPQPIKISPPGQFDQTKPFMYNGQLVYPIQPRFQPPVGALPVPITMLGNTNFMGGPAPVPAGYFPSQLPMPIVNAANRLVLPPTPQFPMGLQPVGLIPPQLGLAPPFMGIAGMLSVSELTRNQLQDLHHLLKVIDHQLLNNKHQIDETQMLNQRAIVESQIETMEVILEAQLKKEIGGHVENRINAMGDYNKHNSSTNTEKKETMTADPMASSLAAPQPTAHNIEASMDEKIQCIPQNQGLVTRTASHPTSRLSAAAAMAPPFQPRLQGHVQYLDRLAVGRANQQISDSNGSRTDQRSICIASLSRAQSLQKPLLQDMASNQVLGFHKSNTFHGQTAPVAAMTVVNPIPHSQAVPYLVGILPTGLKPGEATPQDLTYSRELTDEEIRARHLYWGNAPRHIQSGLPKFDGKDFYPPSPVKENSILAAPQVLNLQHARLGQPELTGRKYAQTVRAASSIPNMRVAATHGFAHNPAGYRPFQRQFFTSGLTSSGRSGNRQAQTISGDRVAYQSMTPSGKGRSEDFSSLFIEHGVSGYRFPSPPASPRRVTKFDPEELSSTAWNPQAEFKSATKNDEASETSTVEIHLTPQVNDSPKRKVSGSETPFAERVANFNSEQQTLFLQNMLKNTATMSSPAQLGAVTSTTAQGYLPQYRGSAAASLSPAILSIAGLNRDGVHSVSKSDSPRVANGSIAGVNVLSENRPLSRVIPVIRPPPENMDAEGYTRYLNQKAEDEKQARLQEWNANMNGTGPVIGSQW